MKKLLPLLLAVLTSVSFGQKGYLQIVHNSPDPAVKRVDVYIFDEMGNEQKKIEDLGFREATGFDIELITGGSSKFKIIVCDSASVDTSKPHISYTHTVLMDKSFVLMICGVSKPLEFAENPEGTSTALTIVAKEVKSAATDPAKIEYYGLMGITDAPKLNINRQGGRSLFQSGSYQQISNPFVDNIGTIILEVALPGSPTPIATFNAKVEGQAGRIMLVVSSGFLQPNKNKDGAPAELLLVFENGTVLTMTRTTGELVGYVQFINNSADPSLSSLDVYANGKKIFDDILFSTGTVFQKLPAGVEMDVAIAPKSSTSASEALWTRKMTLDISKKVVFVINGVSDSTLFFRSPVELDATLSVISSEFIETASEDTLADVNIFPGSIDLGVATLIDVARDDTTSLNYGSSTGSISFRPRVNKIRILADTLRKAFELDLGGRAGKNATVCIGGFRDNSKPRQNQLLKVYMILEDGFAIAAKEVPDSISTKGFDIESTPVLAVSPVPANDRVNIALPSNVDHGVILKVIDQLGKVRLTQSFELATAGGALTVSTQDFENGIYQFLLVKNSNSEAIGQGSFHISR